MRWCALFCHAACSSVGKALGTAARARMERVRSVVCVVCVCVVGHGSPLETLTAIPGLPGGENSKVIVNTFPDSRRAYIAQWAGPAACRHKICERVAPTLPLRPAAAHARARIILGWNLIEHPSAVATTTAMRQRREGGSGHGLAQGRALPGGSAHIRSLSSWAAAGEGAAGCRGRGRRGWSARGHAQGGPSI